MTIHQLQVSYVMEQDRILVRWNTHAGEELRLWLTRRMVKNLFPHMIEATTQLIANQTQDGSHDGADSKALTQFKRQESLLQADFSTPFDSDAAVLPLGGTPLLATTVQMTPGKGSALRIRFEEHLPGVEGTRSFEVTLGPDLLHGFMHLLEMALQNANWGMTLVVPDAVEDANAADAFADAEPPRYLN